MEERIYCLVNGKPKEHPAVFPIELPTRIIASFLEEEDGIVIDPFCGTGTTLVAAKLLGKNYIGIDISEKYVEYAGRRLERAEEERVRVLRELSFHKVELTFRERKERGFWGS